MSYSKTYTGNVRYSGYVNANYPASENGGSHSVHYEGSVPVEIFLNVDTRPFDNSVEHCNNSVIGLNTAVVATQTAQVAEIVASANKISSHISNGFFSMVKSELSQNMSALYSKFNAIAELMADRKKTLEKQQVIMMSDYDRISKRYNQIFTTLDEELKKRIVELDKRAYEISKNIKQEQLNTSVAHKVAQFVTGINEDEIVNNQLLIANTKSRVQNLMANLRQSVVQESVYARTMNYIVRNKKCQEVTNDYVPVLFIESDNVAQKDLKDNFCYISDLPGISKDQINSAVKNHFATTQSEWKDLTEENKASLDSAFNLLAENELATGGESSKRVYDMIMQLKNQSDTKTN